MSDTTKRTLTTRSDQLVAELAHMKDAKARKRQEAISSPPFHELVDEVTASSRRIFAIAADQDRLREEAPSGEESIEDVGAQRLAGPSSFVVVTQRLLPLQRVTGL